MKTRLQWFTGHGTGPIMRALRCRGYSSAGRALAWHARGQRFDPAYLHQSKYCSNSGSTKSPSSRGLGHYPFTVGTGVRIPVGTPRQEGSAQLADPRPQQRCCGDDQCGVVVQSVRIPACHAGGRGFESRPLRQPNEGAYGLPFSFAPGMGTPVLGCDPPSASACSRADADASSGAAQPKSCAVSIDKDCLRAGVALHNRLEWVHTYWYG